MRLKAFLVSVLLLFTGLRIWTNAEAQGLYVAEADDSYYPPGVIANITPAGVWTANLAAGELGTGQPLGIAFNSSGQLFVCAYTNILEISTNGSVSIFANGLIGTNPFALAFNGSGTLFASTCNEYANVGYIIRFNPDGTRTTFASDLVEPWGLVFDSGGNLFVSDRGTDCIYKFTPTGAQSTFASGLGEPMGLAFNSAGNLFEADGASGNIYEFRTNGVKTTFVMGLGSPTGLAFNGAGDLFVGQNGSGVYTRIIEVTPSGVTNSFGPLVIDPWGLAFPALPPNMRAANVAGQVQVSVTMPSPYFSSVVQASTNLQNWVSVYTNTPSFSFTDSPASWPYRFYRALVLQ